MTPAASPVTAMNPVFCTAVQIVPRSSISLPTISLGGGADTSNFLYALKLYDNGKKSVSSASALGSISLLENIRSTRSGLSFAPSCLY